MQIRNPECRQKDADPPVSTAGRRVFLSFDKHQSSPKLGNARPTPLFGLLMMVKVKSGLEGDR
jgi:hypothetical protein